MSPRLAVGGVADCRACVESAAAPSASAKATAGTLRQAVKAATEARVRADALVTTDMFPSCDPKGMRPN